jgi:hypothetical protein
MNIPGLSLTPWTTDHKPFEYDHSITQDELDYSLKSHLRRPLEERYQRRGLDSTGYDEYGRGIL